MVERKKKTASKKEAKIKTEPFPDVDAKYVHHANFASNSTEVFVAFIQVVPPVANGAAFDAESRCINRLIFSSENFAEFVESVNNFWKKHIEQFEEEELVNDKVRKQDK